MLIKVTCLNCGDIAVFDKEYLTPKKKRCFDCYICRNNNKEYKDKKNFLKNNKNNIYDGFDFNKYYGRHKGFIFESITEDEFNLLKR